MKQFLTSMFSWMASAKLRTTKSFPAHGLLTLLIMLLTATTAWAAEEQIFAGFTATGGTQSTSYVGYQGQGYDKAVDGDRFSKWCTFHPTYAWYENSTVGGVFYVDFESAQPIIPTKYILTTGDDSYFWKARNPVSWIVKGKLNKDDDWTVLAKVVDDTRLPKQNSWDMTYDLDKVGKYKYFTFMVSKKVSPNESNMQLGEIRFVGYDNEYDMSTIVVSDLNTFSYNGGSAVSISGYTVKDLAGHEMVLGTDYTVSYLKNGTVVSQVTAKGDYTLRLTGKGSYSGVKEVAFRVVDGLQGTGSSSSPFLIHNVDEWNLFALSVNHGNSYEGQYVKLAGDVNGLSYPAGNTAETSFKGTFLGNNQTMTIAMTSDGIYTAPFRYVEDATISGVCTTGNISTSRKFAAGLIGQTTGTVTISHCVSSVVISSSIDGDGTHGGLVALAGSGTLTIDNSMFKGAINGWLTKNCGGFVGWREGTLVLNDCKMAGTMSLTTFSGSATFSRNNGSGTTLNGCCYYINAYGDVQGLPMSTAVTGKLERCVTAVDGCQYYVPATYSGLLANYVYSGSPVSPEPVVSCYGTNLTKGTDYTLSYANNNQMGTASVIVTGKGQYIGATTLNYELVTTLTYRYYKDGTFHEGQKAADEFTVLASTMTTLNSGWYAVTKDVTINDRIKVNGEVNIVLADGATFTANDGIEVLSGNTLKIYGQSTDENVMGKLVASLKEETDECSTIGGSMSYHNQGTTTVYGRAGTIVIDGGNINVTSSDCYAIGDGEVEYDVNDDEREYFQTTTFNLTINGGIIYLGRGNYDGLYNGSIGSQADDATITINGGKITTENGINCRYKGHLSINDTGRPLELRTSINAFHGGSITLSGQFMLNDGTGTEAVANHVDGWYYTTNFENKTIVNFRSVTLNDQETSVTQKIPFGTAVSEPSRSSHPGYTFVGWANGNALYDFSAPVTADMTITAKYRDLTHLGYTESYTPDGSANNPYIISTIDGWNAFCDALQDNVSWNRFIGQNVQMSNNIGSVQQPVTRMAGSNNHEFCGNFDGGNHTLTFNYTANANYAAPFVCVKGGSTADDPITISNLSTKTTITAADYRHTAGLIALQSGHVKVTDCNATVDISSTKGSNNTDLYPAGLVSQASSDNGGTLTIEHCTASGRIATDGKYAGGLVGIVQGSTTITDCRSSVTINSSTSGDGTHGGIVGVTAKNSGLEIYGCVFNGSLLGADTECVGGFVGWRSSGAAIYNSLFAPNEVTVKKAGSATFARNLVDTYNSYYTYLLNDGTNYKPVYIGGNSTPNLWRNGKALRTVVAVEDVTIDAIALTGTATTYGVAGITAYSGGGISYGENLYYGSADQVRLTLSHSNPAIGYAFIGYTASAGTLAGNDTNGYTLTMPDDDVAISAEFNVIDWTAGHTGTADDPYMIYYKEQLDLLASSVNQGHRYGYDEDHPDGYFFKLGDDIAYDPDVLTIDNDHDGINDSNFMPIGAYVNYAWLDFGGTFDGDGHTISGIRVYMVDGIGHNQGLFGHVYGGTVKNVTLADAQITGNSYVGGIVGYSDYGSTITNCRVVNVSISANGDDTEYFGGIAGLNYGTLRNNLVIGAAIPANDKNSHGAVCGFNNSDNSGSILECNYYTACTVGGEEKATGVGCGYTYSYSIDDEYYEDNTIGDIDTFTLWDNTYPDAAVPALRNNAANATAIGLFAALPAKVDFGWGEGKYPVQLAGRTLWKDGDWNTLCLPFDVVLEGSVLEDAEVMTLDDTTSDLTDGTLNLNFVSETTTLHAGTPYIIKWTRADGYVDDDEHNLVNPVFTGVTINNTMNDVETEDGKVTFKGSYDYQNFTLENRSILFLGADNTLYWPQPDLSDPNNPVYPNLGACRAYFQLGSNAGVREFRLNFGDGESEASGIAEAEANGQRSVLNSQLSGWYTLDGRKLSGEPTKKGLYIYNGRKMLIK